MIKSGNQDVGKGHVRHLAEWRWN